MGEDDLAPAIRAKARAEAFREAASIVDQLLSTMWSSDPGARQLIRLRGLLLTKAESPDAADA